MLRARGSFKWTAPGPGGLGAAIAEMDFGAAPPVLDALAALADDANFGYLPPPMAAELAEACAEFQRRRFGWDVDPALVHDVPDVLKALELAITRFSRPASPVILPTPAYMPFLSVPRVLGREIIQVRMLQNDGFFSFDVDGINQAYRAGGHMFILCNPYNPLGRVFSREELSQITDVVDRHGGRVFADEIHAPLIYPGRRHIPYAAAHGASNAGVAANTAAYRHGQPWLDEAVAYLDGSRRLLRDLVTRHLPQVRYRPPEGTYLAWLDCTALDLPRSPGALVTERARVTVVDGPAFGDGGAGSFRLNFATPRPILTEMIERIAAVFNED
jgi:cystathionine beta-lyase